MIEHNHLYSVIDNKGYRVPIPKNQPETIAYDELPSKSRVGANPSAKIFALKVVLNTTDFQETKLSNRLYCEKVLNWIKDSKATVITDLRDSYKIQLDYTLVSAAGELIDEGVTTQTVEPKIVMVANPLNTDNEMTYRLAFKFDKIIKLDKAFPASFGMINQVNRQYYLKVNGIRLLALSDLGTTDPKDNYFYPSILDCSGRLQMGITNAASEGVCIFDTTTRGINIDKECVPFRPRELGVDITILLNEFAEFFTETEILAALGENNGSTTSDSEDDQGNTLCHPNIHPHYPPHNGVCGDHWCPACDKPLKPNNPDNPDQKPDPNPKPDPGTDDDMRWELQPVDGTTPEGTTIYTVVADDTSDEEFDENTMVKLSETQKYISTAKVGDKVFWGWTWIM